jgi:hypothetical protein
LLFVTAPIIVVLTLTPAVEVQRFCSSLLVQKRPEILQITDEFPEVRWPASRRVGLGGRAGGRAGGRGRE